MENKVIKQSQIKKLRLSRGKTLSSVASECNFSMSLLSKIENGRSSISEDIADKLGRYYGCKISPSKFITYFADKDAYVAPTIANYRGIISDLTHEIKRLNKRIVELEKRIEKARNWLNRN